MATGRLHECTTQGRTHKTCGPHAYEKITTEAISMVKLSSQVLKVFLISVNNKNDKKMTVAVSMAKFSFQVFMTTKEKNLKKYD